MDTNTELANNTIFFDEDGALHLPVKVVKESVWLSQEQLCQLFERDKSVVSRHIKNVFQEGELENDSVVANFATTADDGKTYQVVHYNLDVIISVGYRVKSKRGVRFRQWANRVLKDYILKGFAYNEPLLSRQPEKIHQLQVFLESFQKTDSPEASQRLFEAGLSELLVDYAESLVLLNQFDEGRLPTTKKATPDTYTILIKEAKQCIAEIKAALVAKGEASELFGLEKKEGNFEGIVGTIYQSIFGEDAYPGIEEKAANLLYLIIKNHPFNDGNKRIGAYLMVWYLEKNAIVPPNGSMLVTLALLVAISDAKDKERIVNLVKILISNKM